MNLVGQTVIYTQRVCGVKTEKQARIAAIERKYVYIELDGGRKKLEYPGAFSTFLKCLDDELQSEMERLIEEQKEKLECEKAANREKIKEQRREEEAKKHPSNNPKKTISASKGTGKILKNETVHKNYSIVQEVESTLRKERPDYEKEIEGINKILKTLDKKGSLELNDHVKAMVLSMLSNMREWKPIEENLSLLEAIFCGYDAALLSDKDGDELVEQIKKEKCGNLRIGSQMTRLSENIAVLEKINREHGSIDAFYASADKYELVALLSDMKSNCKLHEMGIPLVCEYLKGVGIPLVKPDRHVCRIIGRLGFSETIPAGEIETLRICDEIAQKLGISHAKLDTILWQYGVKEKCGICGDEPECARCGVTSCSYRNRK